MKPSRRAVLIVPAALVTGLLLSGCGSQAVPVKGKVVVNGKPYQVKETEEFLLVFAGGGAGEGDPTAFEAQVEPDGTFAVPGPKGKGIPPGQYRLTVTSMPYGGDTRDAEDEEEEDPDRFRGKFSGDRSPLSVDVTPDMQEITIDLAKGTVSK